MPQSPTRTRCARPARADAAAAETAEMRFELDRAQEGQQGDSALRSSGRDCCCRLPARQRDPPSPTALHRALAPPPAGAAGRAGVQGRRLGVRGAGAALQPGQGRAQGPGVHQGPHPEGGQPRGGAGAGGRRRQGRGRQGCAARRQGRGSRRCGAAGTQRRLLRATPAQRPTAAATPLLQAPPAPSARRRAAPWPRWPPPARS